MSTTRTSPELLPEGIPGHKTPVPPGPGKSRKRGLIWVLFLLIIGGVTGYAVWHAGDPSTAPKTQGGGGGGGGRGRGGGAGPVPVVVAKVSRSSIPVVLNGLGNVSPYYTVVVKSRVDGQLMKIHFSEGDLVQAGQTLAEIDPRPFQVQLDLAQATLAKDQALLNNAKLDLARYKELVKTNAIPTQTLDTQTALVAQFEATTKQDAANIENANLQLTYAKVTAPITGVLGLRLVDPGNIVRAADANGMVTITQLQPISVLFTIPEDDLPQVTRKLRSGIKLPVEAFNRDRSRKLAAGMLMTLDNQIDSSTGTSKMKAVFDNKDYALFPQQMVNISLRVDTLESQLVVPTAAVQNGQQGTFVYLVDEDSRVHLKPVQVGITTATESDILSGISEGDRVVIDGTDRLLEGAAVRVRKAGEMENPPGFDPNAGGRRGGRGGKKGDGQGRKGDGQGRKGDGQGRKCDGQGRKGDGGGPGR
jgi:membrane fusion protein, multidrug efflux system